MKIFHPETLAETVRETKTESEESDTKLRHYLLKKKPTHVEEETNNEKPSKNEST